jgi:hypothetical protein
LAHRGRVERQPERELGAEPGAVAVRCQHAAQLFSQDRARVQAKAVASLRDRRSFSLSPQGARSKAFSSA